MPYFVWKITRTSPSMIGQKNLCNMFLNKRCFINNNTLKLLYHDDIVKAINGHYEPIIFYNALWEIDQNILPQTKHTNQSKNCPLNNKVKNDLHLCMELMRICNHKNRNMKYHMKMWLTHLIFPLETYAQWTIKFFNDYISIFHFKKYNIKFLLSTIPP